MAFHQLEVFSGLVQRFGLCFSIRRILCTKAVDLGADVDPIAFIAHPLK